MKLERPIKSSIPDVLLCAVAIILVGWFVIHPVSSQDDSKIFEAYAAGSYGGYPSNPSEFSISQPTTITKIRNLHWNSGQGTDPGWIGLMSNGKMIGRWSASGESGNTYWVVLPNQYLQPGTYAVVDSDESTWSQNGDTGGRGITSVYGH